MPTLNTRPPRLRTNRKLEAQLIYNTPRWKGLRLLRLISHPICEDCGKEFAVEVHHIKSFHPFKGEERLRLAYDPDNLVALCLQCHLQRHNKKPRKMFNY